MINLQILCSLVLLVVVNEACIGSGSSSGGNQPTIHNYDISSAAELRRLYNARVIKAERWERPINNDIAADLGFKVISRGGETGVTSYHSGFLRPTSARTRSYYILLQSSK